VSKLAQMWKEAGLQDTSSGRFLSDLADKGVPPKGRGITWLGDLVKKGDPRPWVQLGAAVADLAPRAGTDAETILGISRHLRGGEPLKDWHREVIERVKTKILAGGGRKATEAEKALATSIMHYKAGQSSYYWSHRAGSSRKIDKVIGAITGDREIAQDDIEYLRGNFKSVVRDLETKEFPVGSLFWVEMMQVYLEDNALVDRSKGVVPCIVSSEPFVDSVFRSVSVRILVDNHRGIVKTKALLRNPPV